MYCSSQVWLTRQIISGLLDLGGQIIERFTTFCHNQSKRVDLPTCRIVMQTTKGPLEIVPYGSWIKCRFQGDHAKDSFDARYEEWEVKRAAKDFFKKIETLIPRHDGLTARQRQIWEFIKEYTEDRGYPPSQREIGAKFKITPHGVTAHLDLLEKKGVIHRKPKKARSVIAIEPMLPDEETELDKLVDDNKRLKKELDDAKARIAHLERELLLRAPAPRGT